MSLSQPGDTLPRYDSSCSLPARAARQAGHYIPCVLGWLPSQFHTRISGTVLARPGGGCSFNPARPFPTHWESQTWQPGVAAISLLQCTTSLPPPCTPLVRRASFALTLLLVETRPHPRHLHACLHGNGVIPKTPNHVCDAGKS